MAVIDYTKDPKAVLIDLVNQHNGTSLNVADFTFGDPTPYTNESKPSVNTSIEITPLAGTGFYNSRTVYYHRMDLAEILSVDGVTLSISDEVMLSDYVPKINELFGIILRTEDYYDTPIGAINPLYPTRPRTVIVAAKPNSYFFKGIYELELGPHQAPLADDDGVERLYYTYLDGLVIQDAKHSFICLRSDNTVNEGFNFLGNVTSISRYTVTDIIRKASGEFVFNGDFALNYIDGEQLTIMVDCKSIVVDTFGMLIAHSVDKLFNASIGSKFIYSKTTPLKYVIDNNNINRYFDTGLKDDLYVPGIGYEPQLIRVAPNGKVYTVSKPYFGPDPFIPNVDSTNIRIDRLNTDGSLDDTFATIYMRSSDVNHPPLSLFDLAPLSDDSFYLVVNPVDGVDIASVCPVINNENVVPAVHSGETTYSWNPIFKFAPDGTWDKSFTSLLLQNKDISIYDSVNGTMLSNTAALLATDELVTFFTYKQNPITGFNHRQPMTFTNKGDIVILSGLDYLNQPKWTQVFGMAIQSNGGIVAHGIAQLLMPSGGFSAPISLIVHYKAQGDVKNITRPERCIWPSVVLNADSHPVIKTVFIDEL